MCNAVQLTPQFQKVSPERVEIMNMRSQRKGSVHFMFILSLKHRFL